MTAPPPDDHHDQQVAAPFRRDSRGSTAIEYALIGGLIFLVVATGIASFGTSMNGLYSSIATRIAASN